MARRSSPLLVLFFVFLATLLGANARAIEKRASSTSPPSGAIVVRQSGTQSGEFSTVQAAVNSLPNDSSARTIFIYPGTYNEQVYISRAGKTTLSSGKRRGLSRRLSRLWKDTKSRKLGKTSHFSKTYCLVTFKCDR
ncbi:hypothetical protein LshimejAT787_0411440 [Lyophyllum shimeji]|uniref:Pectinesterase n=1 Tax=Lyophyllum shimeji TaxID=47721 RepID=A0A9P3ULX4_LYOSH|nr:hypothetical protein LshimejAT787_0411440 [Lyophyllum shimeji]